MSTRRRIGVSAASTEAARRQMMQPVPCWEKVWAVPENAPPGSTLKVLMWTKTSKVQQFSDDEGEVDEPLAPLPDEVVEVEGDEEEQEEPAPAPEPEAPPLDDAVENITQDQDSSSKLSSPKPELSMSLQPPSELVEETGDTLDASLKPLDTNMEDVDDKPEDAIELDISALGPDGLQIEGADDLSQIDASDALMGGPLMDEAVDPFGSAE